MATDPIQFLKTNTPDLLTVEGLTHFIGAQVQAALKTEHARAAAKTDGLDTSIGPANAAYARTIAAQVERLNGRG